MKRLGLLAALTLVACVQVEAPRETPVTPIVDPAPPPAPPPPPPEPVRDSCRSDELQYLIGRHKNEIPVPVNPALRRVACTTCPVTMDYNPQRLNIFFDQVTGIIKEVKCG